MIRRTPLEQLKLTTGRPHAIASHSTLGKPSDSEGKANTSARASTSDGPGVNPGAARGRSARGAARAARAPGAAGRLPKSRATTTDASPPDWANARTSSGKPFSSASRPIPTSGGRRRRGFVGQPARCHRRRRHHRVVDRPAPGRPFRPRRTTPCRRVCATRYAAFGYRRCRRRPMPSPSTFRGGSLRSETITGRPSASTAQQHAHVGRIDERDDDDRVELRPGWRWRRAAIRLEV